MGSGNLGIGGSGSGSNSELNEVREEPNDDAKELGDEIFGRKMQRGCRIGVLPPFMLKQNFLSDQQKIIIN